MIKKITYILLATIMLAVNFFIPEYTVSAQTLGDLKRELAQREKEYAEEQGKLNLTEQEKLQVQARITQINQNIAKIGEDIIALNEEIDKLNVEITEMEEEIKSIMSFVQISNGESAYLEYAFGAQDFTDFIYRIAVSEQLTSYNNNLIDEYNKKIADNKNKTEELATSKVKQSEEQAALKVELEKLKDAIKEIDEEVLSIEAELKVIKSKIKVYEDYGCKDSDDIDVCSRGVLPPDTSFWRPLTTGHLTGYYGPGSCYTSNGQLICRNHGGLDISRSGANTTDYPVYSVANGVVVAIVSPFNADGSYSKDTGCGGWKVYIEHLVNGTTYTSAYWHLRRYSVKVGDVVTKNTIVGIMGGNPATEPWDTCTTGAHLHLEMSYGIYGSAAKPYSSGRFNPLTAINFPKGLYINFYDRTTKF